MKKLTFTTIIVLMLLTGSVLGLGESPRDGTRLGSRTSHLRRTKLGLATYREMSLSTGPTIRVTVQLGGLVLRPNHPNPFTPNTTIEFKLSEQAHVQLSVYNFLGQKVTGLLDGEKSAGVHRVQWNGTDAEGRPVTSGIYIAVVEAGSLVMGQRMTLLK